MDVTERKEFLKSERKLYEKYYSLNAIKNNVFEIISDILSIEGK